jgi:hypothetical protein
MEGNLLRECRMPKPIGLDRLVAGAMGPRHLALEPRVHSLTSMLKMSLRSLWSTTRVLLLVGALPSTEDVGVHEDLGMQHEEVPGAVAVPLPDEGLDHRGMLQQAEEAGEIGKRCVATFGLTEGF